MKQCCKTVAAAASTLITSTLIHLHLAVHSVWLEVKHSELERRKNFENSVPNSVPNPIWPPCFLCFHAQNNHAACCYMRLWANNVRDNRNSIPPRFSNVVHSNVVTPSSQLRHPSWTEVTTILGLIRAARSSCFLVLSQGKGSWLVVDQLKNRTDWRLTTWMSEILEKKATQMLWKVDFEPLHLKAKTDHNNDKSQPEIHQRKLTFNWEFQSERTEFISSLPQDWNLTKGRLD